MTVTGSVPLQAVVDTNVFVSAFLRPEGPPAQVHKDVLNRRLRILYDQRILAEYKEVLLCPKFKFDPVRVEDLLRFFVSSGRLVEDANFPDLLPDVHDQPFADVAFTGKADVLITGNVKDFPVVHAIRVLTPREWVTARQRLELFVND
jgi:putative PIN family toxin of toxin-antitoxin system